MIFIVFVWGEIKHIGKSILLFALSLLLVALIAPFVVPIRLLFLIRSRRVTEAIAGYFLTMAIGMDQFAGSVLYGKEDFTVSAYTHKLAKNHRAARYFERFIDLLFGENHCKNTYYNEVTSFNEYISDIGKNR